MCDFKFPHSHKKSCVITSRGTMDTPISLCVRELITKCSGGGPRSRNVGVSSAARVCVQGCAPHQSPVRAFTPLPPPREGQIQPQAWTQRSGGGAPERRNQSEARGGRRAKRSPGERVPSGGAHPGRGAGVPPGECSVLRGPRAPRSTRFRGLNPRHRG